MDNKTSGQVSLPEAGEGAFLQLDIEALEKIETALPGIDDFITHLIKGLSELRPSLYRIAVNAMLRNGDPSALPFGMNWSDLNVKLLDAIHFSIRGKSYDEVKKEHEEQMLKRLEGLQQDPKTAAILESLFSQAVGEQQPSAD